MHSYQNQFCLDSPDVIQKNIASQVKYLQILSHQPQLTALKMQEAGLSGRVILYPEDMHLADKLGMETAIYVDILSLEEDELDKISLSGLPVVIPLFDSLQKTGEISAKFDTSPARLIENLGFLDRDCTIINPVYADKDDLEILGSYSAKVVLTPIASSLSGATFANLPLMRKQGLEVSLGTGDSQVIDMYGEIAYLYMTTLSLLENNKVVTIEEIASLAQIKGENL